MRKKLILVGGGGHCKSCIEVIESCDKFEISGILDKIICKTVLGYPIIGNDDLIPNLIKEGYEFLITVGQTKSPAIRVKLYDFIKNNGGKLATIIAKTAIVSKHNQIGEGTIIMHGAFVNAECSIGNNCIINSRAVLEHEVKIGNHCHISVNTVLNGNVKVNEKTFIGSCAVVNEGVEIPANSVVGANSTVIDSPKIAGTYVGSPSRLIS